MSRLLNPLGVAVSAAVFLSLHLWGRHELKHLKGDQ